MVQFWLLVIFLGVIGGIADVSLNQWSKILSLNWWFVSTILFIVFMTGFGLSMRIGATRGYPLTLAVVLVLLADIMAVGLWDVLYLGTSFTFQQKFGAVLAVVAIACFESGKQ